MPDLSLVSTRKPVVLHAFPWHRPSANEVSAAIAAEMMNENPPNALPMMADEANFEKVVLMSKLPVLVVFSAPWSRPCQILASVLDDVSRAVGGSVKFVKVNADDNPDLSLLYGIRSIPTLLYFVDGNLRAQVVGTASKEAIIARLQTLCGDQIKASATRTP